MAIVRLKAGIDVVEAARQRVLNVFRNRVPVYMSFSGGKDSLCLAKVVLDLINEGKVDAGQLIVHFIDEEAIFPCIEESVLEWRKKFLLAGAKFDWYCVEVCHFNCFNELSNDESFICWDREKEDVWVRRPPSFAIRDHYLLRTRVDTYQDWITRVHRNGINMVGIRTAESLQRVKYIAAMNYAKSRMTKRQDVFPIYDWSNNDVWLYLLREKVDIPNIYLYLWQSGTRMNNLRVSQFFSVDTARCLVQMNEYYPGLMERIIRREPNAYLAALYWDSEMFGRSSGTRKELEDEAPRDYRAELIKLFGNIDRYFTTESKRKVAKRYKDFFIKTSSIADGDDCRRLYEKLMAGDPKLRSLRALYTDVQSKYVARAKTELRQGAKSE